MKNTNSNKNGNNSGKNGNNSKQLLAITIIKTTKWNKYTILKG